MASAVSYAESPVPAFPFDLDGTLIDSAYQHVIAWPALALLSSACAPGRAEDMGARPAARQQADGDGAFPRE